VDAVDLRAERAVAVARVLDVLQEVPAVDAPRELVGRQEVVLTAVLLAGSAPPCGGGDGDLEFGKAGKDRPDERALPRTRRSRDDDDARSRRYR